MAYGPDQILTTLLRDVSRSFYLTLRVLPGKIRSQIGLAYLLARTTDTIADTELVPFEQRLTALDSLRQVLLGQTQAAPDFGELARHQCLGPERVLLENCSASLQLLERFSAPDQKLVRTVLETITSGQQLDLRRFSEATLDRVVTLPTEAELDDYTYRVAGCVGEFWTNMCRAHLFPDAALDEAVLLANAVRFGKGLQLVNILRDLPADLRQGRCYLPQTELVDCGLAPKDLLEAVNEPRFRPIYNRWLKRAEAHLRAGWDYTNMLPRNCIRVRLACAWPLLIGRDTLSLLRSANPLDPDTRVKVTRGKVRAIIFRSILFYPINGAWRAMYENRPAAGDSPSPRGGQA
jgi:farnesyl-diphosphate farnesyltransferase